MHGDIPSSFTWLDILCKIMIFQTKTNFCTSSTYFRFANDPIV